MDEILKQVHAALSGKAYYPALFVCLTLPDICGALESENGYATSSKYIK
jgi:hypothetical protein